MKLKEMKKNLLSFENASENSFLLLMLSIQDQI